MSILLSALLVMLPVADQVPDPLPEGLVVTANLNVRTAPEVTQFEPRTPDLDRPDLTAEEPEPEPEPEPAPEPEPVAEAEPVDRTSVWYALAACESGRGGEPTWDYDASRYNWGSGIFDGGLQFLPQTWTAFGGPTEFAWQASPAQQIEVAERVLAAQGWGAWPSCSAKLGLR